MGKPGSFIVKARALPDGQFITIKGRDAWGLDCLYHAGAAGCTPLDHPGPRWSSYVHKLRGLGFDIETVTENHGGPFRGHHARYVLRSKIELVIVGSDQARAA